MMDRHPTDFVELIFGLVFLATGGGFIVHQTSDRAFDPAWVAAIALVAIGCAFLAVTVLHRPRRDQVDEPLDGPES
jgi:hypothetical protein